MYCTSLLYIHIIIIFFLKKYPFLILNDVAIQLFNVIAVLILNGTCRIKTCSQWSLTISHKRPVQIINRNFVRNFSKSRDPDAITFKKRKSYLKRAVPIHEWIHAIRASTTKEFVLVWFIYLSLSLQETRERKREREHFSVKILERVREHKPVTHKPWYVKSAFPT